MEIAIVLLVLLAGVVYYIVRPDSKGADKVTPAPAPAPAPATPAPTVPASEPTELEAMTKAELMDLASAKEVHAAKSWNKGRIIAALTAEN